MIFAINGCSVDTDAYEVRRQGNIVPVEPQVFDLLVLLLTNSGRVVTKDEIIKRVWHGHRVRSGGEQPNQGGTAGHRRHGSLAGPNPHHPSAAAGFAWSAR